MKEPLDIERILREKTSRHCAAFFWAWNFGQIYFREKGTDYIVEQGTITFVEYKGECYAITNDHVLNNAKLGIAWQERYKDEHLMIALDRYSFWGISPIFVSPPKEKQGIFYPPHLPRDIAIFPFSRNKERLIRSKKIPIALPDMVPEVKRDEIVLSVGFPGCERGIETEQIYAHKLAHIFGILRSITENNIIIYDDNPCREKNIYFGGMSGGPIFKIGDEKRASNYELIGINYEARGFKRLRLGDEIEEIGDDIWVFGFPLDGKRFEAMLNYK